MKRAKSQTLARAPRLSGLASPLAALQPDKRARRPRARSQTGIQSLESGIGLLKALVAAARPMKLRDIASASKMSASKAHRYMVSLCRAGLVVQEMADAEYRLGPYAMEMAIACLNSLRPVKLASDVLEAVSRDVGLTVAIAAWGNHGPTIVRIEESSQAVSMNVRAGTVVPLARSASGRVFAAFMPRHVIDPMLAAELPRPAERKALEDVLETVRRTGVASVAHQLVPGADALAVPIFDHRGGITLGLLAVGSSDTFSLAPDGPTAEVLKRYARHLSKELGHRHAS